MILNLHGGRIDIESEPGEGTEMILYIPYEIGKASEISKSTKPKDEIKLKGLKILIADDEPFNLKLLEAVFKSHDVQLKSAVDGTLALEALKEEPFDLAILDVKMPGYTGFEIVEIIKSTNTPNNRCPMLALTATISVEETEHSKKSGFDMIMRKPFDEQQFLEAIVKLTGGKQKTEAYMTASHSSETHGKDLYDLSTLKSIGDKDFVEDMITTFRTSAAKSIRNLRKATELKIRSGINEEAHKMLPPARHLSANTLVASIEKLQKMADRSSFEDINSQIDQVEDIYSLIKNDLETQV